SCALQVAAAQTPRGWGGRQPLCGIGVTSVIESTCNPEDCSARTAASRPLPGPLTNTSTCRSPCSIARRTAPSAATCAAYGVLLREPLKLDEPALPHESTLPCGSVRVISVLLNVDCTYARPRGMFFRSRRRSRFFPPRVPRRRSAIRCLPYLMNSQPSAVSSQRTPTLTAGC